MSSEPISINQESLCVNINKVYDWVIEESSGSTTIAVGNLPIEIPADATNVVARCILTDSEGCLLYTSYLLPRCLYVCFITFY